MEGQEIVKRSDSMSLKQVTDRVNLVHQVLAKVMKKGTHYGTVPGCGAKMVLLKPGADVLAMTFKLVPQFGVSRTELDGGHREYDVTCSMYAPDGTMLGQGVGSASTMEKKYRYRKDETGKKIENEDIADVYNTVLKIAKKRAHIDATLTVTGAADLFTQDLIDEEDPQPDRPPIKEPQAKATPDDTGNTVTGRLEQVSVKDGQGTKGPWRKYGLMVNGEQYGTFDAKLGKTAEGLKGREVALTWKEDGKYKTATSVAKAGKASSPPAGEPEGREPGQDDGETATGNVGPDRDTLLADVIETEINMAKGALSRARKEANVENAAAVQAMDAGQLADYLAVLKASA